MSDKNTIDAGTKVVVLDYIETIKTDIRTIYNARDSIEKDCKSSLSTLEMKGLKTITRDIKEALDSILCDLQGIDNATNGIFAE